jgi:hypothetical protein
MSEEVAIIVRGSSGSGKSALLGEIQILLQAMRVPHRFEDPQKWQQELNLSGADWQAELDRTKPVVVLCEEAMMDPFGPAMRKAYEDGRQAFRDGFPVLSNPYAQQLSSSTTVLAVQWLVGYNFEITVAYNALREKQS